VFIRPGIENSPVVLGSAFGCWILANYVFTLSGHFIPAYDKLSVRQRHEWNGRLVAMAHACFAITLCPGYLYPESHLVQIDPKTNTQTVNNYAYDSYIQLIYSISIGYFLWDSIICVQHSWGFEYIAHGVLSFFAYYNNLYPFLHHWGRFYLGFFELSTIPLHFRGCMILLNFHKNENKKYFLTAQYIWVAIYTVSRVFIGTYVTYLFIIDMWHLYQSGKYHSLIVLFMSIFIVSSMMILMYYWFYQIINGLLSRGRQNDKRNNEDIDQDEAKNPNKKKKS